MRGFILFSILVIAHAHISIAALVIQGPAKPVLENDEVTLECLLSDSELNTSQVHFEKFSKYMNKWFRLEEEPMYRWCIPGVILRREAAQLLLSIRNIHSYFHQGLYRCVADNATATDNSSQPLAITVNYMRELTVYDVSSSSRKFVKENLRVTLGEDVEVECSTTASEAPKYFWQKYGEDWIVPSPKLRLKNVRMEDGGDYTCMAEHPTLSSLKKSSTISITVLPATNSRLHQAWYDSINLVLITSVAGAVLLVMILSITVFLVRRAKQAKNTKGPIDDHSQKKPIYTASVESLPSTCGDKQPLV